MKWPGWDTAYTSLTLKKEANERLNQTPTHMKRALTNFLMKKSTIRLILLMMLPLVLFTPELEAGEPCCHILICCRGNNKGMKFLVNGQWMEAHDYKDIKQVTGVLQHIRDAGIKTVIIDMTNPSQWTRFWDEYEPMVNNVDKVCGEMGMKFFLFIGAALPEQIKRNNKIKEDDFSFWNGIAGEILSTWAKSPNYRRYGYGDERPMLIVFQPSDMYWERYLAEPSEKTNYLAKFRIGTTQVNDPILPGASDGWGYRNYSQNDDGSVRFACPNGGVHPEDPWYRISAKEWRRRVEWASKASQYSVYGSYDDTCDGIHWGIADTKGTDVIRNKYPDDEPYLYYNILKEILNKSSVEGNSGNVALPVPDGPRLRDLISEKFPDKNFLIGATIGTNDFGSPASTVLDREYSYVTPENDFKHSTIRRDSGTWDWSRANAWLNRIEENDQVLRMHCPMDRQHAKWLERADTEVLRKEVADFYTGICRRYGNHPRIQWMDVCNELVLYDGIGWQAHIGQPHEGQQTPDYMDFLANQENSKKLAELIAWCHARDLEFHITESDVYLPESADGPGKEQLEVQGRVYAEVIRVCMEGTKTGPVYFSMWSATDAMSWKSSRCPSLFDEQGNPKPAYYAVQKVLQDWTP